MLSDIDLIILRVKIEDCLTALNQYRKKLPNGDMRTAIRDLQYLQNQLNADWASRYSRVVEGLRHD